MIAGQKLGFELRELSLHTEGIADFDQLPLPYRAVATDLDTGEYVVLGGGDLADAMRASMSVPGVFTPVEIDGRLLVDGGVIRNLPIDIARELGAERIIAVDISAQVEGARTEGSFFEVASQTITLFTEQNVREQIALLEDQDLLLVPDLGEMRTADFDAVLPAVRSGYEATLADADRLLPYAVGEGDYEAWRLRHRPGRIATPPIKITSVEIVGTERVHPRVVRTRIRVAPGDTLDLVALRDDLRRIYEVGEFQAVEFDLVDRGDAGAALVLKVEEKSWGPAYLRFGIQLNSNLEGRGQFALLANYRRTHLNRLGAEWNNFARIGNRDGLSSEWYQPLHYRGRWFVAPRAEFERSQTQTFDALGELALAEFEGGTVRLDFGIQFGNWGELRVGAEQGNIEGFVGEGDGLIEIDAELGQYRLEGTLDQLDNANFPRYGNFTTLLLERSRADLGADDPFDRLEFQTVGAYSWGRNTITGLGQYGSPLGDNLPVYAEFQLGGFLNLTGLQPGEVRGDKAALAVGTYYRQIANLPQALGGGIYLGMSLEAGNAWDAARGFDFDDLRYTSSIWAGVDTILGPIYAGYGHADAGDDAFFLFLGQPF